MSDFGQLRTGAVQTTWTPHQLTATATVPGMNEPRTVTAFTATARQPITDDEALWWHHNAVTVAASTTTEGR